MSLHEDVFVIDVKAEINNGIQSLTRTLADGCAASFDDYKRIAGKIKGLRVALDIIDEKIKKYTED